MSSSSGATCIAFAASAQKLDVDNRISLRDYYRIADNLLKQADIYREEKNVTDLYIMLLRFSSLITETIPYHQDYQVLLLRERNSFKKKLLNALTELEALKPLVQKWLEELKYTHQVNTEDRVHGNFSVDSSLEWPPTKNQTSTIYDTRQAYRSVGRNGKSQGSWNQQDKISHSSRVDGQFRKPGRASWSNEIKKIFFDLCIEEVQTGGRSGSHLKASSWKKIVTTFNEKTKLNYDQKQLKNMWDIMKKQYAAWEKLLNQTGIGYNEDTHIVTMEPERWEEYLKANPDAKVFRTKPLQFSKEMAILFGGTMATGEAAWTPAFGTIPDDMLRMPSENHNLSFASNPMSPQSSNFQEEDQEIGLEDQLEEVRRKSPCPSRRKKNSGNDALVVSIDNLVSSIDSTLKTTGPTIAECIASLKKFPNMPDRLYIYALNAFRTKENREVWMLEDDDRIRMMWLKANADGGFVA